jgi:hypothetical protein
LEATLKVCLEDENNGMTSADDVTDSEVQNLVSRRQKEVIRDKVRAVGRMVATFSTLRKEKVDSRVRCQGHKQAPQAMGP